MVHSSSTKLFFQVKRTMVLQPIDAKCATRFREILRQCNKIRLDMTYEVQMIGLDATKCSNLSSHVCCAVFETRMVSIQKRIHTLWICFIWHSGMRPKPRNLHTIVSLSTRQNLTGHGHLRTQVDGVLQSGKSQNLQNPLRMWPCFVSSRTLSHMTPNISFSYPTEIIPRPAKIVTAPFCVESRFFIEN